MISEKVMYIIRTIYVPTVSAIHKILPQFKKFYANKLLQQWLLCTKSKLD